MQPQQKPLKKLKYSERVRLGITKGGLNPIAKHKIQANKDYEAKKASDDDIVTCWAHPIVMMELHGIASTLRLPKEYSHAHHVNGRDGGKNLLDYERVCRNCHDYIHKHPDRARKLKLLNF